jgi:hypothetical protein
MKVKFFVSGTYISNLLSKPKSIPRKIRLERLFGDLLL